MSTSKQVMGVFIALLLLFARVLSFPILVFYFVYRGFRHPGYLRHFAERLGALPASFGRTAPGSIWLHAVSVGEVISSQRLIEELRAANPGIPIYLSTATVAGREIAEQRLASMVEGIFYVPLDYAFSVRRVLRRIRPALVVVLETEIWPVLYSETKRAGCGLLIVNGRISDRALPRYKRVRWILTSALNRPDMIWVQSETDRERYIELGADPARVFAAGNLKYDADATGTRAPEVIAKLLDDLKPGCVWIAASTMPPLDASDVDEDEIVLRAFHELAPQHPDLLLLLAPRRPGRFEIVAEKLRGSGTPFVRRTEDAANAALALPCVVLLDTVGELAGLFRYADVVFMGGTLARRGGHNVLEPAAFARPIVVGPHLENFSAIAREFREKDALVEIVGAKDLAPAVHRLLCNAELRAEMGRRAWELAQQNRGLAKRAAAEILTLHDRPSPQWDRSRMAFPVLRLMSFVWRKGSSFDLSRRAARARSLTVPVVSIGGISMGGTGKTPVVKLLAKRLRQSGWTPAVLTRGYRRKSIEPTIVVKAGASIAPWRTGDEAQILVRGGDAHVGIGADRWQTGQIVQKHYEPDVFLLDDGFQHRQLRRDLDIVAIDALNPFSGGDVFPLGRLREPLSALSRADIVLLTRTVPGCTYDGVLKCVREHNATAPIFRASVQTGAWVNLVSGERAEQAPEPAVAFCGLANPNSFWQSLRAGGIDPAFTWAFSDHHRYKPAELRRLAWQARQLCAAALLTTEKDAVNLPENAAQLVAPLPIYWLEMEVAVEGEEELLALIRAKLPR